MAKRLKSGKETSLWLIKLGYGISFPFLVGIGAILLYALNSPRPEAKIDGLGLFTLLVWSVVLIPLAVFAYRFIARRRLIRSITSALRHREFFAPDSSHEVYHDGEGKYLGIDINNGTVLYVHKIRNGAVDVLAMNMSDWLRSDVDGEKLSIFTKLPELPRIEIVTPWAQRFHDTLGALAARQRGISIPFSTHVFRQLEQLERELAIQIPRFA
jgi:hypothetical protein